MRKGFWGENPVSQIREPFSGICWFDSACLKERQGSSFQRVPIYIITYSTSWFVWAKSWSTFHGLFWKLRSHRTTGCPSSSEVLRGPLSDSVNSLQRLGKDTSRPGAAAAAAAERRVVKKRCFGWMKKTSRPSRLNGHGLVSWVWKTPCFLWFASGEKQRQEIYLCTSESYPDNDHRRGSGFLCLMASLVKRKPMLAPATPPKSHSDCQNHHSYHPNHPREAPLKQKLIGFWPTKNGNICALPEGLGATSFAAKAKWGAWHFTAWQDLTGFGFWLVQKETNPFRSIKWRWGSHVDGFKKDV